MGLRRLAPIRVESLPRAAVRSQRIAGARRGARACGGRLGRCATAAAWITLRLWPFQAQAAPGSVRVRLGLPFYLTLLWLTYYGYTHYGYTHYGVAWYGYDSRGVFTIISILTTAKLAMAELTMAEGGAVAQRAYCGHAYTYHAPKALAYSHS